MKRTAILFLLFVCAVHGCARDVTNTTDTLRGYACAVGCQYDSTVTVRARCSTDTECSELYGY